MPKNVKIDTSEAVGALVDAGRDAAASAASAVGKKFQDAASSLTPTRTVGGRVERFVNSMVARVRPYFSWLGNNLGSMCRSVVDFFHGLWVAAARRIR